MQRILLLVGLAAFALLLVDVSRTAIPGPAPGAFAAVTADMPVEATRAKGPAPVLDVADADDPAAFRCRDLGPTPLPHPVAVEFRPAADPARPMRMARPTDEPPRRA